MASTDTTAHAAISRSTGLPAYLGKATAEVGTKLPEAVADEFKRICCARGVTVSETLRDMVLLHCFGFEEVQRMRETQLRMVAGMPPQSTPVESEPRS